MHEKQSKMYIIKMVQSDDIFFPSKSYIELIYLKIFTSSLVHKENIDEMLIEFLFSTFQFPKIESRYTHEL